jgi:hypothetical protein
LVQAALTRGQQAGCGIFFLAAALTDWPRVWHTRLGFVEVNWTHQFTKSA